MHHAMHMGQLCHFGRGGISQAGGCRDPEQGLRPGLHLEAGGSWPGQGAASYYIQASESGGEPPRPLVGPRRQDPRLRARPEGRAQALRSALRPAQGPRRNAAGQAPRRRAQSRRPVRPRCWPPNRTPPPDASTSCGSKPPGKPGKAPSSQLIGDCGALAKAGYTPLAMDNSAIGTYFPYRPILDQLIQKQFSELNHFTVTGAPGTAPGAHHQGPGLVGASRRSHVLVHVDPRDALVQHLHAPGHLLQRHPPADGNKRAARQSPGSVQETDARARSSNGGYPARGSGGNLIHGLERSIGNR